MKPADDTFQRALALHQAGEIDQARALYEDILKTDPGHADALHLLGLIAHQTAQPRKALELIGRAITVHPATAVFHTSYGVVLQSLGRGEDAVASYDKAIALNPDYADAWNNRGNVLYERKQFEAALASYDKATALKPRAAQFHNNRATVLRELHRYAEAQAGFERAIAQAPDFAEAHNNLGNTLKDLQKPDAAVASYDRAIALKSDYVEAYANRGNLLLTLQRHTEAVASLARVVALAPDLPFAKGYLLHAKMLACDWSGLDELCADIEADVLAGKKSADPFGYQGVSTSEHALRRCAEIFAEHSFPAQPRRLQAVPAKQRSKIRLGYLCGEFRNQATSILMTEVYERHDKSRFEVIALDNGWDDGSQLRARINAAFDEVVDISAKSDVEAATLIAARDIDILINLNGYFGANRPRIFSHKPCPVQVNYLGFPGTIGAPYIDYLIADRRVIPENSREYYVEKIAYLPDSYQANDTQRHISERVFTRAELGLPAAGFVFCCFNNNYKITPRTFDGWMRILKQVDGSVLWLLEDNATAAANLRQHAKDRGINPDRLIFAPRMGLPEHLARHRAADLFLDTLPYNAHTTASDALWAGLPVLTCVGSTFPGRVGASLLSALGDPELITVDQAAYEDLAVRLATHAEELTHLRQKLADNRLTTALFDSQRFTAHLEDAYQQMFTRAQAGLPPDHISVG